MPRWAGSRTIRTSELKAKRRAFHKLKRQQFQVGRVVQLWVKALHLPEAEREWRIRLLIGPDDRSLTGRILGDPRYLRSALYRKHMQEKAA